MPKTTHILANVPDFQPEECTPDWGVSAVRWAIEQECAHRNHKLILMIVAALLPEGSPTGIFRVESLARWSYLRTGQVYEALRALQDAGLLRARPGPMDLRSGDPFGLAITLRLPFLTDRSIDRTGRWLTRQGQN